MHKSVILLTGATGFLGSHLLEVLIGKGHPVVVLKRSTSSLWRIKHLAGKYKSYNIDLVSVESIFNNNNIEIIIHLATLYKKFEEVSDISEMIDTNVSLPSQLLIKGIEHNIKSFINTGTFFEYDCGHLPIDENSKLKAFNFYAKTKLAFEIILKTYSNQICINSFKIFSPFGEKDNNKLVSLIIKKGLDGGVLELSEGFQKIDLIYVKDIVNAYVKSIERMEVLSFKPEFESFNLGSGVPLSIRDISSIIEDAIGKRIDIVWGEASKKDIPIAYANISKARQLLDWRPTYGVKTGINNLVNFYKMEEM